VAVNPATFAPLLLDSILRGLKTDLLIGWNVLLTHPWLAVVLATIVAFRILVLLSRRGPQVRRQR
jgi:hypothetical protein